MEDKDVANGENTNEAPESSGKQTPTPEERWARFMAASISGNYDDAQKVVNELGEESAARRATTDADVIDVTYGDDGDTA